MSAPRPPAGSQQVAARTLKAGQHGVWVPRGAWWYPARVVLVGGRSGRARTALVEIRIRDGRLRTLRVAHAHVAPTLAETASGEERGR